METIQQQLRNEFRESHEVEIASSAEEALALMEEIQNSGYVIEVVIADQVMPGMKGSQFLEEVHKKFPDSIKIMLTGQAGLDSAIHAINHGGLSRYVEKPWNTEELTGDIRFLIEKFRQNLENQHLINELSRKIQELEKQNQ
ncbi:response regulator receiver domain protein [Leptospira santarosai str. ST188]|uniref:Response regulator receiver domain protein n=1 Tax=Leptospira santarosai str. MOR084 TaxID=1049984 RepID=A0A0E2B9K1_9LEPT|nr:response regulator receiver domain protein [Leptospira santarosai str. MOR084]EMF89408.1 response regulator receiver domain protein [Leptospira santarosai str. ST188]EMM78032.1 response regulator receiver domain protein [Leptospira santarosai str. 2000030832]EMM84800.1 response regulator receiver domain protein [Leptospira santarosai str. 2000027870]EMO33232.1 response regulator receiver domain protein [Leptospira santarosai str. HAI821]EMO73377.1 response regulator receiver domain protein 